MIVALLALACADPPKAPVQEEQGSALMNGSPDRAPPPPVQPGQPGGGMPAFHATPDFQLSEIAVENPRSILIISLDTVRADRLGVYGGRAETPNLSNFAAQGKRFDQAISHFPETCLSHWSMLSGVLPEAHGNAPANGGSLYKGPTVAEIAKKYNYSTAAFIGGITLTDQSCGLNRGFDTYDDKFAPDRSDMKRPGAEVTELAAEWIGQQQGPYFAFVHYFDAHFPYTPAAPWDTRYDPDYKGSLSGTDKDLDPFRSGKKIPTPEQVAHVLSLYDGEISELDALLAPLLAAAGPDTVVLITSDHGESFEHNYWFNHRAGLWDGVTHVPLLLRGPGVEAGSTAPQQVGLVDVAPTVLTLAGLPTDTRMHGKNIAALSPTSGEGHAQVVSITDPFMPLPQWAVRTPTWKVIEQVDGVLYYDLAQDPAELKSLADVPKEALVDAHTQYNALMQAALLHQAEPPKTRFISAEEQKRLEALGYVTPGSPPPGPTPWPPQNTPPVPTPPQNTPPAGEPDPAQAPSEQPPLPTGPTQP